MSDVAKQKLPRLVKVLIGVQLGIYAVIASLSPHFDYYATERERPIIWVVSLLLVNFALHLGGLAVLLKAPDSRNLGWQIALVALAMRLILIGSTPIQEVDIYRYIWDGIVTTQGISPFRYPPVAITDFSQSTTDPEVEQLRGLVVQDDGICETLHRVHFPELPTVYPTTSQVVFACAAMITPAHSSVMTRVLIMKSWIVAFDLGAMGLIWLLLRHFGKHSAWLIVWGWSPLVLKEFANSGHLDSIAAFFTLAATYAIVVVRSANDAKNDVPFAERTTTLWGSGLLMGLAVASKLYPVVLLLLWIVAYSKRSGWRKGIQLAMLASLTSFVMLLPMVWDRLPFDLRTAPDPADASDQESLKGLSTFLTRWEMNDLLFMIVEENIRPANHLPNQPPLWFVVVPDAVRQVAANRLAVWSGQPEDRVPFLTTRALTLVVFAVLLLWLARRVGRKPEQLPQGIFLALAWFWFLSPTQNPWYWCWALAYLPFANSKVWLFVSGLSLVYYLRFWLLYHAADVHVFGTYYRGNDYFDFVVVWLEFAPFLAILAFVAFWRKRNSSH